MAVTLKDQTEVETKSQLEQGSVVVEWLFRWAAMLCSRYLVGKDGRSPFERRRGRACRTPVACFGETVYYKELKPGDRKNKFVSDWSLGVWLGHTRDSSETVIGTNKGVVRAYAVKRLPADERWQGERLR